MSKACLNIMFADDTNMLIAGNDINAVCNQLNDCSSFIRHLWQSTKHIKWSSKVVHKNNIIRAYNHTTCITRSYSASQVACTHVLVVWISSNQLYQCITPRAILPLVLIHGIAPVSVKETRVTSSCINTWKHTVSLTQNEDIRTRCTPRGMHCRYNSWIQVIVKHTQYIKLISLF